MRSLLRLHREQALPVPPSTIAACHETVVVLLDNADTTALRHVLAGGPEVRLIRITRRPDTTRVRADVECLAGTAETVAERLHAASGRGEIGPVSTHLNRSGSS